MLADLLEIDRTPLSLQSVVEQAPAQTRVDRKYVVPLESAQALVDRLGPEWGALSIAGRATTRYRSTYVDTPDLLSARAHVQRRRRRWKARSRLYVEDGLCRFEVKTRDGRGQTVKAAVDREPECYSSLTARDAEFLLAVLGGQQLSVDVRRLVTTVEVTYERLTLARLDEPCRTTIDWGVRCRLGSAVVWIDPAHAVVETKGTARPAEPDRLLVAEGHRPRPFSKYAAAASLLRAGIPDNDVRPLLGRVVHTSLRTTDPKEDVA